MQVDFTGTQKKIIFNILDHISKELKNGDNKKKIKKLRDKFIYNRLITQLKKKEIATVLIIIENAILKSEDISKQDTNLYKELCCIKDKLAFILDNKKEEDKNNAV